MTLSAPTHPATRSVGSGGHQPAAHAGAVGLYFGQVSDRGADGWFGAAAAQPIVGHRHGEIVGPHLTGSARAHVRRVPARSTARNPAGSSGARGDADRQRLGRLCPPQSSCSRTPTSWRPRTPDASGIWRPASTSRSPDGSSRTTSTTRARERRTSSTASAAGQLVVLVTDAGMPSVSDPGYRLVAACVEAGLPVTSAPGPSAAITALALSGLPVDRFCFEGFLPRKSGQRRDRLRGLASEARTMVFFEAPHRTADVLADMSELWGESRAAAVCRELTKTHEEVRRGSLIDLVAWAQEGVRGEVTIVVSGASDDLPELTDDDLAQRVREIEASGSSRRDAVDAVSAMTGISRRRVYAAAVSRVEP